MSYRVVLTTMRTIPRISIECTATLLRQLHAVFKSAGNSLRGNMLPQKCAPRQTPGTAAAAKSRSIMATCGRGLIVLEQKWLLQRQGGTVYRVREKEREREREREYMIGLDYRDIRQWDTLLSKYLEMRVTHM